MEKLQPVEVFLVKDNANVLLCVSVEARFLSLSGVNSFKIALSDPSYCDAPYGLGTSGSRKGLIFKIGLVTNFSEVWGTPVIH